MSKEENRLKGPTYFYGPKGEAEIFHHHADVPEDWKDAPVAYEPPEPPPSEPETGLGMNRKEIVAALKDGGIAFQKNAGVAALYTLLVESLKAALTEAKIEFDPASSDAKALMGLFPTE